MTLLVLELAVDTSVITTDEDLMSGLSHMWGGIFTYIMTFIALGAFWLIHRYQFNFIRHADGVAIWLNIFFLTTVAIYPFTNSLLSYMGGASIVIFSANAIISNIILFVFWWYASSEHRLLKPNTSPQIIKLIKILPIPAIVGMPIASVVALLISYEASIFILFFLLAFYVFLTASWSHKIRLIEVGCTKGAESESDSE